MDRRGFLSYARTLASVPQPAPSSSGIAQFSGPWDRPHAVHLVRRTGFGAMKREVDGALNAGSAEAAVDAILEEAVRDPLPEPPTWYERNSRTGVDEIYDLQRAWFNNMRYKGLIEKMTLFWHNHFVTQYTANDQKAPQSIGHLTYDYYKLLRTNALGNFREFVYKVGLNPAMLIYLDGNLNERGAANENYARELLELFTMSQYDRDGNENYTEQDIKQIARAITGWVVTNDARPSFVQSRHDRGSKTFFGRTGTFDYDDVLNILFEERSNQIAYFVCKKLYTFFIHALPNDQVIADLADVFVANDFEIVPVLRTLFMSEHFYDNSFKGSRIKSPVEYLVGFLRETELIPTQGLLEDLRETLSPQGLSQELFNPPNVAGWPGLNPPDAGNQLGHFAWLTTTTLPERWNAVNRFLDGQAGDVYNPFDLATKISDPSDPFRIADDFAATMIPIPLEKTGVRTVEEEFGGNMDIPPPEDVMNGPSYKLNLSKILLDGTPFYEWPLFNTDNPTNVQEAGKLIKDYLVYLVQLPAYQLT